jgi:hypothetical protein
MPAANPSASTILRTALACCLLYFALPPHAGAAAKPTAAKTYEARYLAEIRPEAGVIHMELKLVGERLPRKLVLRMDPKRHRSVASTDPVAIANGTVTWQPRGKFSRLNYDFVVNHERAPGRYDSLLTTDWTIFRGDKLVPRASVTAVRGLQSQATLEFVLPAGWSVIAPYGPTDAKTLRIDNPQRRFDRPEGWMLAGKFGSRAESIAGVQALVAAPAGDAARRQDTLAFLNWNLPHLLGVFPSFPKRLLVVCAGDPMWRGGLSGPGSLFLHSDRPLISENRTSTLLHELVHVAMGIHGDAESDWIAEGFAEFYSLETLRRSGSIGKTRYRQAMEKMVEWSRHAPSLFAAESSGARTARAAMTLKAADEELRSLTGNRFSLDDVARELAAQQGKIGLERLQAVTSKVAGRPLKSLERDQLNGAK